MSMIKQSLVSRSKYSIKCPYSMTPIGIAIHNTYNDSSAANEISYMKSNNNQVSFHIAVDDKEAIQGLPLDRNSWSCGDGANGQGNRKHISIEICYSKSGGSKFIESEKNAAKVVAELLKKYNWGIDKVKAHRDFANKNCPHRTNMTEFKKLVENELNKSNNCTEETKYRIVTGSFGSKEKAEDNLKHLQSLTNLYSWVELEYGKTDSYRIAIGAFIGEDNTIKYMEALKLLTNWWMTYEIMQN